MNFKACLDDQIGRLVHPAACASAADAARQRVFVVTRLAVAFGVLALIPAYLVAGNIPHWADAIALAWLVVPLLAVLHVSRTGDLAKAELLSLGTWIGLAVTLVLGHACGLGPALVLLMLAPLEACWFASVTNATRGIAGALGAAALLIGLTAAGLTSSASSLADIVVYGAAALYGCALAWAGLRLRFRTDAQPRQALDIQALSEATGDIVLELDRTGAVMAASVFGGNLPGLRAADLTGRGLFDRVHVADRPIFLKLVSDGAAGQGSLVGRVRLRVASEPSDDGAFLEPHFAWTELRVRAPAALVAARADGYVLVLLRDITDDVIQTTAFEKAARDAESASAWKDRFLATVSHELRTPLNAIIGFGEILASEAHAPADPARRHEYAEIIHASGRHLLSVVNSLLDMSKIDAGKLQLECEPFDVPALIAACCDMVRLKAEQSRIDLIREIDPAVNEVVGDQRACKQIVLNLLSNALKFTPEYGSVTISARRDGDMLAIAVADTGIGMVPPDLARLGDPFFQAQNSYDRRYEGTGLGLSVVSGLVGLHGGTIAAESAPGEGTRMTIRLPRHGHGGGTPVVKAKIEVLARQPRHGAPAVEPGPRKVQKIA